MGGAREVALATLIGARLASGAISPNRLPTKSREARANGARNWLLSLALPQAPRAVYLRLIEATGTDDTDDIGQSLAKVIELSDPYLDQASRLELGRLVHRISLESSTETLERQVTRVR